MKLLQCSYCGKSELTCTIYECERCGADVCSGCTSHEEEPLACNELTDCYAKAMSGVSDRVDP